MKKLSLLLAAALVTQTTFASTFDVNQFVTTKSQEYSVSKTNPYLVSSMLQASKKNADNLKKELQSIYDLNKDKSAHQLSWVKLSYATKKQLSCRLADAVIIVNGVAETVPLGVNLAPKALTPSNDFESAEVSELNGWLSAILGGGLDSVWRVIVETTSSFDSKKIEAEIAKSYPATTIVARKVKGDESTCYKLTLIVDLLQEMQDQAQH